MRSSAEIRVLRPPWAPEAPTDKSQGLDGRSGGKRSLPETPRGGERALAAPRRCRLARGCCGRQGSGLAEKEGVGSMKEEGLLASSEI